MLELQIIACITIHKAWNGLAPTLEYTTHPSQREKLLLLRDSIAHIPGITNIKPSIPDDFFTEIREIPDEYLSQFKHMEIVARVLIVSDGGLILELNPIRLHDKTMPMKAVKALLIALPLV